MKERKRFQPQRSLRLLIITRLQMGKIKSLKVNKVILIQVEIESRHIVNTSKLQFRHLEAYYKHEV